jgi:hypothetical protein
MTQCMVAVRKVVGVRTGIEVPGFRCLCLQRGQRCPSGIFYDEVCRVARRHGVNSAVGVQGCPICSQHRWVEEPGF